MDLGSDRRRRHQHVGDHLHGVKKQKEEIVYEVDRRIKGHRRQSQTVLEHRLAPEIDANVQFDTGHRGRKQPAIERDN